ncbi:unnamed protein product, partial [marine sediment metagenome]
RISLNDSIGKNISFNVLKGKKEGKKDIAVKIDFL